MNVRASKGEEFQVLLYKTTRKLKTMDEIY